MEVLIIENLKYDKIFYLTHCFLINTVLFVRIVQKSKAESGSSHSNVFMEKNNKVGKILEKQL